MSIAAPDHALHPSSPLRWLYIDFNSYFASVEQQLNAKLRGRPVAVVPVQTDSTCAIAASYEAKAFGVRTGTPIYEAKRLCPDLVCVLAQHEHYVEYHHRILQEIDRHIPVSAVCSIDEAACRLMRNEQSAEKVRHIAGSIKSGLTERVGEYITCSIGVAPNRYLAKVAADLKKPNGFTILGAADLPQALLALQPRDLPGIGHHRERRLRQAGIVDMKALMALSAHRMRTLWGNVWGERLWYLLRGADLPEEETRRSTIGHSHVMAPELRAPRQAVFVARRLTLKAASRLRRLGYRASRFHLGVRPENGPRLEAQASCVGAQDSPTFLALLDACWKPLMREAEGARIKKLSVTLSGLTAAHARQPGLFSELPEDELACRHKAEKMSAALDKINHRFGRDTILVGMLPSQGRSFSGTKIAFTRIPDTEEFLE